MANHWTGMGRLVRDVDFRESASGMAIARYTLAVDRRRRRDADDGQPTADFIPCVAFGKSAEFANNYFKKGMRVFVEGRIQTGSYEKDDGTRVYTTDIMVENQEFADSKNATDAPAQKQQDTSFLNVPAGTDEELPFA